MNPSFSLPFFFKIIMPHLFLVTSVFLASCESKEYAYSTVISGEKIESLMIFKVPDKRWRSPDELGGNFDMVAKIEGNSASDIWEKFSEKSSEDWNLTTLRFSNQDYQIVAKKSSGKFSSLFIGQVFYSGKNRLVSIKGLKSNWLVSISLEKAKMVGLK